MEWPISWNDVKEALDNGSGGGLPVVELETLLPMDAAPVNLTEADSAKIREIAKTESVPFVLKFRDSNGNSWGLTLGGMCAAEYGTGAFSTDCMGGTLMLVNYGDGWTITLSMPTTS